MSRIAPSFTLNEPDKARLRAYLGDPQAMPELVKRAHFLLRIDEGATNFEAGNEVNINKGTGCRWRQAVLEWGLDAFLKDAELLGLQRRTTQAKKQLPKRRVGRPRKDDPSFGQQLSRLMKLEPPATAFASHFTPIQPWLHEAEAVGVNFVAGIYMAPPNYGFVLAHLPKPTLEMMSDEEALAADDFTAPQVVPKVQEPVRIPVRLVSALSYIQSRLQRYLTPLYDPVGWLGFLQQIEREWPEPATFEVLIENAGNYTYQNPDLKTWLKDQPRFGLRSAHGLTDWVRLMEQRLLQLAAVPGLLGMDQWLRAAEALEIAAAKSLETPKPYVWVSSREYSRWMTPSLANSEVVSKRIVNFQAKHAG
jgi:hypothetical protein